MGRLSRLLIIVAILFCSSNIRSQTYKDSLNLELTKLFQESEIPGFFVMILEGDNVKYQKGFGYADIQRRRPFTKSTIQNIGSVSKTFIAVALMKAIELGYFTLETDVNEILPFKVENPFFPKDKIKVRYLTDHTSGIVDNDSIYHKSYRFLNINEADKTVMSFLAERGYTGGIQDSTLSSFMESYLDKSGRLFSKNNFYNSRPGKRSSYSNIASALVAYLIEIKSGKSFSGFTAEYIFKPLIMSHSKWFLDEVPIKDHAIPYFNGDVAFPFYSLTTYPDGGLITSALDLKKYTAEMIKGSNGHSKLLQKKSFEEMFRPNFSESNLPDNFSLSVRNKGIFWSLYNDGFIGHDGDDPGVSTNLLFNETNGIIFLANIYMDYSGDRSEILDILKKYSSKL